jgi:hypothetical protein
MGPVLAEERRKLRANMERDMRAQMKAQLRDQLKTQVEIKLRNELSNTRKRAFAEADAHLKAKVSERDTQIAGLRRQIEQLRRKADQASEQNQGEAFEQRIIKALEQNFPQDEIVRIRKGRAGADIVQRIHDAPGQPCGALLWECKSARTFKPRWLSKLRADRRAIKAEAAILAATALPKDVETFALINDVWVVAPHLAIPLAALLRHSLVKIATVTRTAKNVEGKSQAAYHYLTGSYFRQHIESMLEAFIVMQADLESERRAATLLWAKREAQLVTAATTIATLYGDLQGVLGKGMPEIKFLGMPTLEGQSFVRQIATSSTDATD